MNFLDNGATSNFFDIERESSAKNTVKREFIFIIQIYPSFVLRLTIKFFYLFVNKREREILSDERVRFPGARHKFRFLNKIASREGGKKKKE